MEGDRQACVRPHLPATNRRAVPATLEKCARWKLSERTLDQGRRREIGGARGSNRIEKDQMGCDRKGHAWKAWKAVSRTVVQLFGPRCCHRSLHGGRRGNNLATPQNLRNCLVENARTSTGPHGQLHQEPIPHHHQPHSGPNHKAREKLRENSRTQMDH